MIKQKELIPISLILIVAIILRFLVFFELPFTHDEFSTLFRLNYDNFSDLIKFGVYPDGHPAGFHLYSYFMVKLFGSSEEIIKLPIIILGILSVLFSYLLAKRWFNSTSALYVASFFSVLQYTVVQSQVARMYGFGIFFVLLMVYFWQYLLNQSFKRKHIFGFIISAIICIYTHYFSMLLAAIVGITGIFFVTKNNRLKYVLSGVVIIALFIPGINIFFNQLSLGGIEGWLGAFEFSFLYNYFAIVFNRSWLVAAIVIIFPVLFLALRNNNSKFRTISLVWFLLPMLVGSIYSFFISNVMHERVLYFSFPFLLLFIASFIKKQSFKAELLMVVIILAVGTLSLVFERQHYKIFKKHRYKMIAETFIDWQPEIAAENYIALKYTYNKVDDYYKSFYENYEPVINYADSLVSIAELVLFLENTDAEYLYFGHTGLNHTTELQIAKHYFPEIVKYNYTLAGEVYLLKKNNQVPSDHCYFNEMEYYFKQTINEAKPEGTRHVISSDEYIGTIESKIGNLIFSKNNLIEISADFIKPDSLGGAMLVSSIEEDGEVIDWRGIHMDDFVVSDSLYNTAMFTVPFPDIRFNTKAKIKFVIWNPKKVEYEIKDFKVRVRAGNPYVYSDTKRIPWNLSKYCM